jgi:transketolase
MEAQPLRVVYGKTLVELGERDRRVVVFEADVAKSTNTYRFRQRFPERFFQAGVAELNMVCMAAGAASVGLVPFASTFAVFASMRACEGIRTSICYPKLNVKIVAANAGVENHGDGVTHQGIEDMAIMRALPNMTVVSPSDPVTTRLATLAMAEHDGPCYMRVGRCERRVLYPEDVEFRLGKMLPLREGNEVAIIATGNMVEAALEAAGELAREGIQARVLDCHTIKPLDAEAVVRAAVETRGIVTAEDHNVIGGLGSAVAEVVAENHPTVVRRVGLGDVFARSARGPQELLAQYGIDARAIAEQARRVAGRSEGQGAGSQAAAVAAGKGHGTQTATAGERRQRGTTRGQAEPAVKPPST